MILCKDKGKPLDKREMAVDLRSFPFAYFTFEDIFGRKWALYPNSNKMIEMPFVIVPLKEEKKDE